MMGGAAKSSREHRANASKQKQIVWTRTSELMLRLKTATVRDD